jgi:hypothetical protein
MVAVENLAVEERLVMGVEVETIFEMMVKEMVSP